MDEFLPVQILNVSLSNYGFVIFLKPDNTERVLPICVGAAEVNSISAALTKQKFPRPLSHTLFKNILAELGATLEKIHVTDLKEGTFYAKLFLDYQGRTLEIDSRPSDAIALALRYEAPMFVRSEVFEEAGVLLKETQENDPSDPADEAPDESQTGESSQKPPTTPLEKLKKKLQEAIGAERYEDAAKIHDQIQQIQLNDLMEN